MLTAHDLRRLAVQAICAERTARRWAANRHSVSENSRIRLDLAAKQLGIELPEQPKERAA